MLALAHDLLMKLLEHLAWSFRLIRHKGSAYALEWRHVDQGIGTKFEWWFQSDSFLFIVLAAQIEGEARADRRQATASWAYDARLNCGLWKVALKLASLNGGYWLLNWRLQGRDLLSLKGVSRTKRGGSRKGNGYCKVETCWRWGSFQESSEGIQEKATGDGQVQESGMFGFKEESRNDSWSDLRESSDGDSRPDTGLTDLIEPSEGGSETGSRDFQESSEGIQGKAMVDGANPRIWHSRKRAGVLAWVTLENLSRRFQKQVLAREW